MEEVKWEMINNNVKDGRKDGETLFRTFPATAGRSVILKEIYIYICSLLLIMNEINNFFK